MNEDQLNNALAKYKEIEESERKFREAKSAQIMELEHQVSTSYNRNIYRDIYKNEFGEYREFVQELAKKLRKDNKNDNKDLPF